MKGPHSGAFSYVEGKSSTVLYIGGLAGYCRPFSLVLNEMGRFEQRCNMLWYTFLKDCSGGRVENRLETYSEIT